MSVFTLTPAQLKARDVLISDATHTALGGGSRSGKTFLLVRMLLIRAITSSNSRHVIFRFRMNHVISSIVGDTLPKVLKLCFPGLPPLSDMLNRTFWVLTLPNGSEIYIAGLDDKERTEKILGQEFSTIYFNECSQIPWRSVEMAHNRLAQLTFNDRTGAEVKNRCYYDFNPPSKKHWTYLLFVEGKSPNTRKPVKNTHNYGFFLINPADNTENLSRDYIEILEGLSERDRNRFLLGRFADDNEGQLWTEEVLEANREMGQVGTLPMWTRVLIAVDPSGCSGDEDKRSDEVGIAVVALGDDNHAYLLEDLSGRYRPEEWAKVVSRAFERHDADAVVGEVNYGGDMVRAVLQAENARLPYRGVTATRGKHVRAEPVSALYEKGLVHHVGYFEQIEDQLLGMTQNGYMGVKSPDRADALIWALTELFPKVVKANTDSASRNTVDGSAARRTSVVKTSGRSLSRFDTGRGAW